MSTYNYAATPVPLSSVTDPNAPPPQTPDVGNIVSSTPSLQLARNPQLPQHPLGAYTDAQYEAQVAQLRANVAKQYQDVLQQLGYVDPQTGQFIMGSVEAQAQHQQDLLNRSVGLAREDVTKQHQQLGTLFSGLRGTDQARAEFPYTQSIADLQTQTPLSLGQLYEKGAGLIDDYTLQQNQLLADAASRQAANLMNVGGGAGAVDMGTPPPPDATAPAPSPTVTPPLPPPNVITPGANLGDPTDPYNYGTGPIAAQPSPTPMPTTPVVDPAAITQAINVRRPGLQI